MPIPRDLYSEKMKKLFKLMGWKADFEQIDYLYEEVEHFDKQAFLLGCKQMTKEKWFEVPVFIGHIKSNEPIKNAEPMQPSSTEVEMPPEAREALDKLFGKGFDITSSN